MTTSRQGNRIIGTVRADDGKGAIRMEDVFATGAADLWSALVDPDRLSRWVADVTGDLRPGGRIHARFTSGWEGDGYVNVCEPHLLLLATMNPGSDDETVIEARLTEETGGTRLVVEERGLPLDVVAAHGAGWQTHVEDLATYLAGDERGDWVARMSELKPEYRTLARDLA